MMSAAPSLRPVELRSKAVEHRFYIAMAAAVVVTAMLGFVPSLIEPAGRRAPLTALVGFHSVICVAWLVIFSTQVGLAATRRISTHRRLGVAAALIAVALIVVGYFTSVSLLRRGFDLSGDLHVPPVDAALQIVFPIGDLLTFAILVAAGYVYRRRPDYHKRCMLLATIGGLMPAPLAHFIGHWPALARMPAPIILIPLTAFFFAAAVFDRVWLGRMHPVSLWGGIAMFAWSNVRAILIGPSAAWHHFATWLAR